MKKILLCLMVAVMMLSLLGCGSSQGDEEANSLRIVSMAPSNTEIVAALGGVENLVGVSDLCDYPAEVASIEKIGDAFNPNYEKIVSLHPDYVLLMSEGEVADRLRELDLEVIVLTPITIEEIFEDILTIADLLEVRSKGEELVANMRDELQEIEDQFQEEKPTVFMLIDSTSFWTVGANTFSHEVLEKSGFINVAAIENGWYEISQEKLLELDPDYIVFSWPPDEEITSLPAWQNLTAVKEGRVVQIDPDITSRSGPRIVEGIKSLHNITKGE